MDLTTITIADFKARFYRDFSYQSVPTPAIDFIPDPAFVQDQDIQNAFNDAQTMLNQAIFGGADSTVTIAYLYLSAHCLCLNIQAAESGVNGSGTGGFPVVSRGVGSVSESYQVPDAYKDDPYLAQYTQTSYGQKYLAMALPFLRGNMVAVIGGAQAAR